MIFLKHCTNCGSPFESENPTFCGDCGQPASKGSSEKIAEEKKSKADENKEEKQEAKTTSAPVQQVTVEKGLFVDKEAIEKLERRNGQQFQPMHRYQKPYRASNNTITTIAIIVVVIGVIIGGYFYYQHWQEQKRLIAEEEVFQKDLEDFRYEFETQWEMLLANTVDFKEKCDNVYNKQTKDMSLQDKLHNIKSEAIAYRKSLETIKMTLDKIQMTDKLVNHNDLGDFLSDLLVAVNVNIDYCDNVINLCGNPKEAKKEAQNKGQDTENSYMMIYRNKEFKKYFSMDMRIDELDSIGGQVEVVADERVKELKKPPTKNNGSVVININGKTISSGGGNNYIPPVANTNYNGNYNSQVHGILKKVVSARIEFGKIPQKYRSGQINRVTYQTLCNSAGKQRDMLVAEMQSIGNVPTNEAGRHQKIIECLLAGSAACYNITSELNKSNGGDWELVLKSISDYNSQNLDPILDYYQIF